MALRGHSSALAVIDPPWDSGCWPPIGGYAAALVFCDGQRLGDVVREYGPPAWAFVWDCQSCWYTPGRPLKKHKQCLWFGDAARYVDRYRDGSALGGPRAVRNTRGQYTYTPDVAGKRLIDLHASKITRRQIGVSSHEKPVEWVRALIENCASGASTVVDPFAGGGSVAIASAMAGMSYYGRELSPEVHKNAVSAVRRVLSGGRPTGPPDFFG